VIEAVSPILSGGTMNDHGLPNGPWDDAETYLKIGLASIFILGVLIAALS
jgi:hypothetical protein